jgi:ABC-2 type transport system permease protein
VTGDRTRTGAGRVREKAWWRQALHLSRAEFVQLRRARITLLYLAGLPVLLALIAYGSQGAFTNAGEHVDAGAAALLSSVPMLAATMGLLHIAQVFTVRREQHILNRLRVGGVATAAVLAAVCAPTLAFVLTVTGVLCALGIALAGTYPAAPELLLIAGVLASVSCPCSACGSRASPGPPRASSSSASSRCSSWSSPAAR